MTPVTLQFALHVELSRHSAKNRESLIALELEGLLFEKLYQTKFHPHGSLSRYKILGSKLYRRIVARCSSIIGTIFALFVYVDLCTVYVDLVD